MSKMSILKLPKIETDNFLSTYFWHEKETWVKIKFPEDKMNF